MTPRLCTILTGLLTACTTVTPGKGAEDTGGDTGETGRLDSAGDTGQSPVDDTGRPDETGTTDSSGDTNGEGDSADTAWPGGYEQGVWLTDADVVVEGVEWAQYAGDYGLTVGDFSGDGLQDLIMDASNVDTFAFGTGGAYLMSGPLTGSTTVLDASARLIPDVADGAVTHQQSLPVGDLDGDGYEDILLTQPSTPYEDSYTWGGTGVAYYVAGPIEGDILLAEQPMLYRRTGFGDMPSAPDGDMDDDGQPGFLLSNPEGGGLVYHFDGPPTGSARIDALADVTLQSDADSELNYLGAAIAGGADLSGDGVPDVAIASGGNNPYRDEPGLLCVLDGPLDTSGVIQDLAVFCTATPAAVSIAIDLASDVSGDGQSDLIVALEPIGYAVESGKVYVIPTPIGATSSLTTAVTTIQGTDDLRVNAIVESTPDLDGKGNPGLLVTVGSLVAAYVSPPEGALTLSEADVIIAPDPDCGGDLPTTIGDLNDDGLNDIVVGAALCGSTDMVRTSYGAAYAYFNLF